MADARQMWAARAALALAGLALAHGLAAYLVAAGGAIRFPYELDYGEGIVWQQMRMIVAGDAYGPIAGFPAIVFHYPPLFHALAAGLADVTGLDELAAGRLLSVASTLLTGVLAALIVARIVRAEASPWAAVICGALTGLIVFGLSPVLFWSMLMRVDMVALALSFAGLYFGLRALGDRKQIHLAALCFVAALYTRQTSIAAPAAVFTTLLFVRPRTAWAGLATATVTGLTVMAALQTLTDGGFLRHILLYNINRFVPERLMSILWMAGTNIFYLGVAVLGMLWRWRRRSAVGKAATLAEVRTRLSAAPGDAGLLMLGAFLLFTTLMLMLIAKSGSSINYFLEWVCALALFAGIAMRGAAAIAIGEAQPAESTWIAALLPLAIVLQLVMLPVTADNSAQMRASRVHELARLTRMVRNAPRPVISDDMVLLLRAGQRVLWEPAIFAELASDGVWDERAIVEPIRNGAFGFFVTVNERGDPRFDSRYNPAVADAIDAAYPIKRGLAGYTLHLPAAR